MTQLPVSLITPWFIHMDSQATIQFIEKIHITNSNKPAKYTLLTPEWILHRRQRQGYAMGWTTAPRMSLSNKTTFEENAWLKNINMLHIKQKETETMKMPPVLPFQNCDWPISRCSFQCIFQHVLGPHDKGQRSTRLLLQSMTYSYP